MASSDGPRALTDRPARLAGVTALLAAAMAAGTLVAPSLAVLASFVLEDLALSRTELGVAFAVYYGMAALGSPWVGRLTDATGGRRMLTATFVLSGAGFLASAGSGSLLALSGAAVVAGLGQAAANPSTNKLLSLLLPAGRRGLATGLKQSGVQAGVFLSGIALPSIALAWGWRVAMGLVGVLFLVLGAAVTLVVPPADGRATPLARSGGDPKLPRAISWLAGYGLLMGAAGGAVTGYLPLYAEEGLGLSVRTAGMVAAAAGAAGFVARIAWSTRSERARSFATPLGVMGVVAAVASLALLAAAEAGAWLLWAGAVAVAATGLAWNSVGMLAVMHVAGSRDAGRASGIVLLGFLAGFSLGPPAFGWSVDTAGSYRPGLAAVAVAFMAASLLMVGWSRDLDGSSTS